MSPATHRIAAIDIGTVTTRLLIADVGPDGITEVKRSTDITHLGEGLTATGRLSDEAMARVGSVIAGYAEELHARDVEACEAVATSASRDAANAREFATMLVRYGIEPRIVGGSTEARLAFAGATHGIVGERLLVNDIGGGSTELIYGRAFDHGGLHHAEVVVERSVDVGSRRVTEMFLASDPPTSAELDAARMRVRDELVTYFDTLPEQPRLSIALAGTATTLSSIHQEMEVYDPERVHGSSLSRGEIAELLERLATLPLKRRKEVVGLDPGRAPVIVAGTLILVLILDLAGLDSTTVSEHDILYGIVLDAYARMS